MRTDLRGRLAVSPGEIYSLVGFALLPLPVREGGGGGLGGLRLALFNTLKATHTLEYRKTERRLSDPNPRHADPDSGFDIHADPDPDPDSGLDFFQILDFFSWKKYRYRYL